MARQHLFCCSVFSVPMLIGSCLPVFVRNDGSPTLSFIGMCAGAAIAVSRGLALKALMIFCLPLVFGTEAIWLAPFVTEAFTLAAAVVLHRTSKRIYQ